MTSCIDIVLHKFEEIFRRQDIQIVLCLHGDGLFRAHKVKHALVQSQPTAVLCFGGLHVEQLHCKLVVIFHCSEQEPRKGAQSRDLRESDFLELGGRLQDGKLPFALVVPVLSGEEGASGSQMGGRAPPVL